MTDKKKKKRIFFNVADDDMKEVIQGLAEELGVPPADIMNLLTLDGIEDIEAGGLDLGSLRTDSKKHPGYDWRLDLSERLARFRKRRNQS